MSDEKRPAADASSPVYEPPTVTLVGNARDLLAGTGGTQPEGAGPAVTCGSSTSRNPSDPCT